MLKIPLVKKKALVGSVHLPTSKSISHRYQIIQALAKIDEIEIKHISTSNDTQLLQSALDSSNAIVDFEDAGTPMRFYLAYAAVKDLRVVITGNSGLKARPIAPLVDALSQLGCLIKYMETPGCLPLKIEKGVNLESDTVKIDSHLSSQFLSALLLVAPVFHSGLKIISTNAITSAPYIRLTTEAMLQCGVKVTEIDHQFIIPNGCYSSHSPIEIEADWSAAAFVFAWAMAKPSEIDIVGLNFNSSQGDKAIVSFFEQLGLVISAMPGQLGLKILNLGTRVPSQIVFDFTHTPDMFPVVAATCAYHQIQAEFTGVKNLTIKESNRIEAMQTNLIQTGAQLIAKNENELFMKFNVPNSNEFHFKSYNDHRIAMACSIFAFKKPITIDNEQVVKKSFPHYWQLFQKIVLD